MPCTHTGSLDGDKIEALTEELDKTTRLLCELCRQVYPVHRIVMSVELLEWWFKHRIEDGKRK